ncbi:MAG TPA: protein-L-isoaspartate(D-aspartate) O-methyltransferase [Rudaea sp.]|nr:protein-L-isoaspartate(D-aspartate) O-methyltransferase [Rudaea sp.]
MNPTRRRFVQLVVMIAGLGIAITSAAGDEEAHFVSERAAMVKDIATLARFTGSDSGRSVFDARVMSVLNRVPRHRFVPEDELGSAYANRPLSIGYGQTISQPYIVALMTDLLDLRPGHRVLEIGTGSGYQAAILAELVQQVYSIEIVAPLAEQARARLAALGYANIEVRNADGYYGWPEQAPFDAIVVTAAAGSIPPPLIQQLKTGGRLVIPVGSQFFTQTLMLVEKRDDGKLVTRELMPVAFVPLTGRH